MNAETYAEWLRHQGHKVIRTASSYWHSEGLGVYQAFPYHLLIQPSEKELSGLFHRERAIAVRYSAPAEAQTGYASFHIVCEGLSYGFENLGYRTRKNVRRGLRCCKVALIPFERVAEEGWALHLDTLCRQERRRGWTHEVWRERFLSASRLAGFEAWGATVGEKLAAYIVTFQMQDCCYIVDQKSAGEFLNLNVNNALSFTMTQEMFSRRKIRSILYGVHSLDAPTTVDEFKYHMGYVQKPVKQRIAFHPYVSALVNSSTHSVVRHLVRLMPRSRYLSKAEGIMRKYQEQFSSASHSPELTV